MAKKTASPAKLKWLESYEKYLKSHKAKVFDKKARAVMKADTASSAAAMRTLKRLGLISPSGKLNLTA